MPIAGTTNKPCPSCGEKGLRLKDKVCSTCAANLEAGRRWLQDVRKQRAYEYNLPKHWPPIPTGSDVLGHSFQVMQPVGEALSNCLLLLAPHAPEQGGYGGATHQYLPGGFDGHGGHHWVRVLISPEAAEAIQALHQAIGKAAGQMWRDGLLNGQNMLKGLATGSISSEQFDSVVRRAESHTKQEK